ncbi:MAG: right-handed parallel beta-helix repeat-containing protein [Planctomycetota bacterium]|jgi:predicted outer membrane repeat protein
MKAYLKILLSLLAFFLVIAPFASAGKTIYVDADVAPGGDGTSWARAFRYLQDALAAADANDEVRVAQGTYVPDQNSLNPTGSGDRKAAFRLISGVAVCGGYAGCGEPDPNDRNVESCQTILSGDLNGDDGPGFANNSENSYHVITAGGTGRNTTVDGFTITAGNADCPYPRNRGGGMYNDAGNPTVTNCVFSGNNLGGMYNNNGSSPIVRNCVFAVNNVGGMYNKNMSSPSVINCTFSGNTGGAGGGILNRDYSSPIVDGCTFKGNLVSGNGGGMCNSYDSCNSVVANCTFIGNSAAGGGGAMHNYHSSPTITNCMFIANSAHYDGGAVWNGHGVVSMITNCVFTDNQAGDTGGGIFCWYETSPTLSNCILWGNTAGEGPQIALDGGYLYVGYCNVEGGKWDVLLDNEEDDSILYWLDGNIDSDPYFADADNDNYHLKSQAGRWEPNERRWTTDEVTSPCIDAGDPNSDWTAELWPHGKRVNMGAFGGTPQASMSLSSLDNVADIDDNGRVDYTDMRLLAYKWLRQQVLLPEDLNRDAIVNFFDLAEFVEEWPWQEI